MSRTRDPKTGKFLETDDPVKDAKNRQDAVAKEHGYNHKPVEIIYEMKENLDKLKSFKKDKNKNEFGFSNDFFEFLGLKKTGRNYLHDLSLTQKTKLTRTRADTANYFNPVENYWTGSPTGGDVVNDYGRVPVSHLIVLCTQRLGICHRATNGTASDIFRNGFDFVKYEDPDKVIEFNRISEWMRPVNFWDHMVNLADLDFQTGLSHLIKKNKKEKTSTWINKPSRKLIPDDLESWSCYHMTPINVYEASEYSLDYDKTQWDYQGGILQPVIINRERVYTYELLPMAGQLRGIALPELCYTPLMCYLNTMYYILKDLSQMGVAMASINTEAAFPSLEEFQAYLDLWEEMRANNLFVLGKNATFNLKNVASQIGAGIESYLEFLREDISSAWIIPKNQLFGRAEGGGLDGAGALISKEDYLASNISVKQLKSTNDIMKILIDFCGFKELEGHTIRWNIDLHKSEEQRLNESFRREEIKQAVIQTSDMELLNKLNAAQVELQIEIATYQKALLYTDPDKVLGMIGQRNLEPKPVQPTSSVQGVVKADMIPIFKSRLDIMKEQYRNNNHIISSLLSGIKLRGDIFGRNKNTNR